jgi:hypothetical protein
LQLEHNKPVQMTRNLIILVLTTFVLLSCTKEETPTLDPPFDKVQGLDGTWEVSSAAIIDEQSVLKDEIDLSDFYTADPSSLMRLTFNSVDFSYSVEEGEGINYFGSGGNWEYDDPNFPAYIYLYTQADSVADTIVLQMGTTVNEFINNLDLKFPRECNSTVVSAYRFSFQRQ